LLQLWQQQNPSQLAFSPSQAALALASDSPVTYGTLQNVLWLIWLIKSRLSTMVLNYFKTKLNHMTCNVLSSVEENLNYM